MKPLLVPLFSLKENERFVLHIEGYLLPDYWRSEIFEFKRVETINFKKFIPEIGKTKLITTKKAFCWTTQKNFNTGFFFHFNCLVFPIERNKLRQMSTIKKNHHYLSHKNIKGVPFSNLTVGDRFYLTPSSQETFTVLMQLPNSKFWSFSDRGNGDVIQPNTIVYID